MFPLFADEGISLNAATSAAMATILLAVVGALVAIFKLLLVAKDQQVGDWKERCASYQKLAERAVQIQEERAERESGARGLVSIPMLAPVPPSHNSPISEAQQFAADFESLKARQVAAELKLKPDPETAAPAAPAAPVPTPVEIVSISPEAASAIKDAMASDATAVAEAEKKLDPAESEPWVPDERLVPRPPTQRP